MDKEILDLIKKAALQEDDNTKKYFENKETNSSMESINSKKADTQNTKLIDASEEMYNVFNKQVGDNNIFVNKELDDLFDVQNLINQEQINLDKERLKQKNHQRGVYNPKNKKTKNNENILDEQGNNEKQDISNESIYEETPKGVKKVNNNVIKGKSSPISEIKKQASDIILARIDYSMEFGGLSSLRNFDSIKKLTEATLLKDTLNDNVDLAEQRFALYNKENIYAFENDLKKAGLIDKDAKLDLSTKTGQKDTKQQSIRYLRARGIIHSSKENTMTLGERITRRTIIEKNYKKDSNKTAYDLRREDYGIAIDMPHRQSSTDVVVENIVNEVINPTPNEVLTEKLTGGVNKKQNVSDIHTEMRIHNILKSKGIDIKNAADDFDRLGEKYRYGQNVSSGSFKQRLNKGQEDEVWQLCSLSDNHLAKIVKNKETINGVVLTNADIMALKLLRDTDNSLRAHRRLAANNKMIVRKKADLVLRNSPSKSWYLSYRRFSYKRKLYSNICKNIFKTTIFLQKNMIVAGIKVSSGTYLRIKSMVSRNNSINTKGNYKKETSSLVSNTSLLGKSNFLVDYANIAGNTIIGNSVRKYARKRADIRNINTKRKIKIEKKKIKKENLKRQRRKNRLAKKQIKRNIFAKKHPYRAKIRAKMRAIVKKPLNMYFKFIDISENIKQAILKKVIAPALLGFIKIMAIIMIIIVLLSVIVVAVGAVISWFAGLFDYSMKDAYQYVINTENSIIAEKLLTAKNSCETEKINVSYYTMDNKGKWMPAKSRNNAKEIVSMVSTVLDDQTKDNGSLTRKGKKNFKKYAKELAEESIEVKVESSDNIGIYLYSFKTGGNNTYKLNKTDTLFAIDNKNGVFYKYLSNEKKKTLNKKNKSSKSKKKKTNKSKKTKTTKLSWLDNFTMVAQAKKLSNSEYAFNFFVEKGCNKNTSAAIVGNLIAESGVNPGMSGGIAQWQGGRLTNLQTYCKNHGYSWKSLDGQLNYMWFELKTGYIKALSDAQRSAGLQYIDNSDKGAVYYIARYYEGCIITDSWHKKFGCRREGPTQIKNHRERTQDYYKRLDAAKNIYNGGSLTGGQIDTSEKTYDYNGPEYWDNQTMGLAIAKYSTDWKELYDIDTTKYNIDTSTTTITGEQEKDDTSNNNSVSEELKNTQKKEEYFPKGFVVPVKKIDISKKSSGKISILNTDKYENIKCGYNGKVSKIDKNDKFGGTYVQIKTSKCYLIYGNIKPKITKKQAIKKGQIIGKANGDTLYFAILDKSEKEIDSDFALQEDSVRTLAALYGLKFVGGTYVWGGTDLEHCLSKNQNQGVDCSGFVMKCYQHYNVYTLPHQSVSQYNSTSRIKEKDLLPGDLIFYSKTGNASDIHHVAMYIGNGQIVHAKSRNTGIVVDKYTYSSGKRLYGRVKIK